MFIMLFTTSSYVSWILEVPGKEAEKSSHSVVTLLPWKGFTSRQSMPHSPCFAKQISSQTPNYLLSKSDIFIHFLAEHFSAQALPPFIDSLALLD
jgi:hypothetical protein